MPKGQKRNKMIDLKLFYKCECGWHTARSTNHRRAKLLLKLHKKKCAIAAGANFDTRYYNEDVSTSGPVGVFQFQHPEENNHISHCYNRQIRRTQRQMSRAMSSFEQGETKQDTTVPPQNSSDDEQKTQQQEQEQKK